MGITILFINLIREKHAICQPKNGTVARGSQAEDNNLIKEFGSDFQRVGKFQTYIHV